MDNFNIKQWLVENKITTQSRLNEEKMPSYPQSNQLVENTNVPDFKIGDKVKFIDKPYNKQEKIFSQSIGQIMGTPKKHITDVRGVFFRVPVKFGEDPNIYDVVTSSIRKLEPEDEFGFEDESDKFDISLDMREGISDLQTLADYKVAFDIAASIGVTAASVGLVIYMLGIKETIKLLKFGAKEFMDAVKYFTSGEHKKHP